MDVFDESGGGLTELIMVMALMVFFGMSIYLIIYSGSSVMQKVDDEKNAQIEARTALSYINVRLRQFDAEDAVVVTDNGYNGGGSILLQSRNPEIPELDYDTWIYWDDGKLMEVLSDANIPPQWDASNTIAQIDGMHAEYKDGFVTSTIIYTYNGEKKTISSSILLRSDQKSGLMA